MKLVLLAAAAALAAPAVAQTQPGQSMPDSATPATPAPTDAMAAPGATGTTVTSTTVGNTTTTVVQNGGMMGGAGIAPQPISAPTPVDPNPPVCRKGQFDDCRNGPQSTHSRDVHRS